MLQFLTYLLHKQIIEMGHSQNLRCPFSVPSRRLCVVSFTLISNLATDYIQKRIGEPGAKIDIKVKVITWIGQ